MKRSHRALSGAQLGRALGALCVGASALGGCTALYPEEPLPAALSAGGAEALIADMSVISVDIPDQDTSPYVPLIDARPCPVSDDVWQRASGFSLPPIDAPAAEGLSPRVSTFSCPEGGCAALALSDTLSAQVPWLRAALRGEGAPTIDALRAALSRDDELEAQPLPLPITAPLDCPPPFEMGAAALPGAPAVCALSQEALLALPTAALTSELPVEGSAVEITGDLDPSQLRGLSLTGGALTVSAPLRVSNAASAFDLTVSRSVVLSAQPIIIGSGSRVEISSSTLFQENSAAPVFIIAGGELVLRDVMIVTEGKTIDLKSGQINAEGVVVLPHPEAPLRLFSADAPFLDMSATTQSSVARLSGVYVGEGLKGPFVKHQFADLIITGLVTEPIEEVLAVETVVPDLRLSLKNAYLRAERALSFTLPSAPASRSTLCELPEVPERLDGASGVTVSAVHIEGAEVAGSEAGSEAAHVSLRSGQVRLSELSTRGAVMRVEEGALALQEAELHNTHIHLRSPSSALTLLNVRAREEDPLELRALIENVSGGLTARYLTWEGGATLIEHPGQGEGAAEGARPTSEVCHARLTQGEAPPFRPVVIASEGDLKMTHVIGGAYEGWIASKSESEGEVTLRDISITSAPRALQEGLRARPMSLISVMSRALSIERASLSTSVVHNTTIAVNRTTQLTLKTLNLLNIPLVGVTRLNRDLGPLGVTDIHQLHLQAPDTSPLFNLHPVAFLSDEGLILEYDDVNLALSRIYSGTGSVLFNATGADRPTAERRLRLWESGFVCHNAFYLLDCDDMSREPYKPVCDIAPSSSPEPLTFP
jgi:hypothetical protein